MTWDVKPLADVVELRRGFDLPTSDRVPGEFPVISAGKQIGTHHEAKVDGPGFAVGRATNLGVPQWSDQDYWPLNTTLYAASFKGNNPRWLFHLFQMLDLTGFNSGSVQPMLNRNYIAEVQVRVPPRRTQDAIGEVLGALDDKIAANRRVIAAGDSLVRVLYSSTPKMPQGRTFADVADVGGGGTPSTKNPAFWDGGVDWATPTDVTGVDGPWLARTTRSISEEGLRNCSSPLYPEGSILMTSRATIGAVVVARKPMAVNQGFIVLNAVEPEMRWWLESQVRARTAEFETWANGATFLEISRGTFKKLTVLECSPEDLDRFNRAAQAVRERQWASQTENDNLARIRDELLPLLMSGGITVKDAERAAEDVL